MQLHLRAMTIGMLALTCASGCSSDSEPPKPEIETAPEQVSPVQTQPDSTAVKPPAKFEDRFAAERKRYRRKDVFRSLGGVKDWHVSTERDGKTDPELVAAEQRGEFEKVLKTAFSHYDLELKFFVHLPKAVAGLHQVKPAPETCDFTCTEPVEFASIRDRLEKNVKVTEDKDSNGKPRKWYRDEELSLGVVDDVVTIVRIYPSARTFGWKSLDTPD